MAVIAKWMCDRDNSMFDSKKEADAYDKMLELAETFTALLQEHVPSAEEKEAEEFGIYLAQRKEQLIQAFKGKPEILNELDGDTGNVTALAVNS